MQEKGVTKILNTHKSLVYLSEHTKVFCSYINVYLFINITIIIGEVGGCSK